MLNSIMIKDYALIENINAEFNKGLNIITGETGAGKSIIIDSMGLLLGERASTEVVRKGSKKAIVEGFFNVKQNEKVFKLLTKNEIDFDDELIVRREISLKGSNRCFLNDTPAPLSLVKEVGNLLVDLHGQHEHQSLLRSELHIEMLDEYAGLEAEVNKFSEVRKNILQKKKEIDELLSKELELRQKKEFYQFQIKEIDEVSPEEGEDEKLEDELKILENSENLLQLTTEVYGLLYEAEGNARDALSQANQLLSDLRRIDSAFDEKTKESSEALALINDIAEFIRSYKDKIDMDPERIEAIRERLGSFSLLKKKYGLTLEKVIEYRKKIDSEVDLADSFSDKIKELENKLNRLREDTGALAKRISSVRIAASKKLKKEIEEELKYLGIPDANFEVLIQQKISDDGKADSVIFENKHYKYDRRGFDEVEFFISSNIGEDPKPLAKIASGGEISRIMLALKTVLAKNDRLPLLIFDEIDSGVSGRIAQKVGQSLKSLAAFHQIIAITHLPQIAGLSDHHYAVEKKKSSDRVVSSIRKLDEEEKVREVAKLMSGEEVTESSLEGARELMKSIK